jgi:hypothetical protein
MAIGTASAFALVVALGVALGACQETPEQELDDAITTVCRCAEFLPAQQQECVAELESQPTDIGSASCEDCIEQEGGDCSELLAKCIPLCEQNQNQDPEPGDNRVKVTKEVQ